MSKVSPVCRICYEESEIDNPLINPCLCTGSHKYIHVKCLERWRNSDNSLQSERRTQCMECKYKYKIQTRPRTFKCHPCISHIIIKKKLYIVSFFSVGISYTVSYFHCSHNLINTSFTIQNEIINCYNTTPIIFIGMYIIIINYYYCLLHDKILLKIPGLLFYNGIIPIFSCILLYVLGPFGILLISFLLNIIIQSTYYNGLIEYYRPEEYVENYIYVPSEDLVSNILEYRPPSNMRLLSYSDTETHYDSESSSRSNSHSNSDSDSDSSIILSDLQIEDTNINIIHL